jgi:NAD(P)H-hydrate repair Nnr-like enzyme with NAD(P)H-hydrate dehydratase domain
MMLIAGTIPVQDLPLTFGEVQTDGESLIVDGKEFGCMQGTGAMISAALTTTTYLKLDAPKILIAGDIGNGKGSREIYQYLIDNIEKLSPQILALHYWLPDMAQTRQLCSAIDNCRQRPILIADAASMYSAKAAGLAEKFDVFTPDATEIAFLADPSATHPAYVSRHLFETDIRQAPALAEAALKNHGAAKLMLIKGSTDYVFQNGKIIAEINEPNIREMEAIGGTGDTITGILAAMIYTGLEPEEAAVIAARVNRMAGKYAGVTPASKVKQIIDCFPLVFKDNLCQWSNICYIKGEE